MPSIHVTEMTNATTVRMPFITRLYLTCGHAMYSDAEPIKPQTAPYAAPAGVINEFTPRNRSTNTKNSGAVTGRSDVSSRDRLAGSEPRSGIVQRISVTTGASAAVVSTDVTLRIPRFTAEPPSLRKEAFIA